MSKYITATFRLACYAVVLCGAISLALGATFFAGADGPDSPRFSYIAVVFFVAILVQCGLLMAPTALASRRNAMRILCILAMLPPYAFVCLSLWPCINPASYTCQSNTFQVAVIGGFAIYTWALVMLTVGIWHRPRAVV